MIGFKLHDGVVAMVAVVVVVVVVTAVGSEGWLCAVVVVAIVVAFVANGVVVIPHGPFENGMINHKVLTY